MVQKKCPKCQETKDLTEFHKDSKRKLGVKSYCKKCVKVPSINTYSEEEKEEIREIWRMRREANKEKINERARMKITCECGKVVSRGDLRKHKQTKQHKIKMGLIPDDSNCPCGGKYTENNRKSHAKTKKHMEYTKSVGKECGWCLLYEKDKPYDLTTCPEHRRSDRLPAHALALAR